MRQVIRRHHKAPATEADYVHWLQHYPAALQEMPAAMASEQKRERFLTDLALKRDAAASTQNQAFNAIAFFYRDVLGKSLHDVDALRATRPVHLRHAPTISETRALPQAVSDLAEYPTILIAGLLYGCELRVTEPSMSGNAAQRIEGLQKRIAALFHPPRRQKPQRPKPSVVPNFSHP
jgi:hypothetical protein